jgi:enterobacterial common antigen flippase
LNSNYLHKMERHDNLKLHRQTTLDMMTAMQRGRTAYLYLGSLRESGTLSAVSESILAGLASQVFLLVSGIFIARLLGPDGRGHLALLNLIPALLTYMGLIGLPQSISSLLAKNKSQAIPLLHDMNKAFLLQWLLVGIVYVLVPIGYIANKDHDLVVAGSLAAISIPGLLLLAYGLSGLQGLQIYREFNVIRSVSPAGWAFAALILYITGQASLPIVVGAWSAIQIVSGLVAYGAFVKHAHRGASPPTTRAYSRRALVGFGLRGMVGHMAPLDTFRLDQLALGVYLPPSMLGVYVVAQAFTNLPRLIAQSIGLVAFPAIARGRHERVSRPIIFRYLAILILVVLPSLGILMTFMPIVISFVFGPEFNDAVPLARILLIGAAFGSLRNVIVEALRGFSLPQVSTYAELSMYPAFVVTGALLVPAYNALGMAVTVTVTQFFGLLTSVYFFWAKTYIVGKQ